ADHAGRGGRAATAVQGRGGGNDPGSRRRPGWQSQMSIDPALLARYLAQVGELGGADLFLDSLTAREARRLVAAAVHGDAAAYPSTVRGGAATVARDAGATAPGGVSLTR